MTFFKVLDFMTFLSPLLLLLGIAIGMYYYKFLDTIYKVLLVYLIVSLCTDVISRIYGHFYRNNLIFILVFSLTEAAIFSILYHNCFFEKRNKLMLVLSSIAALYMVWEIGTLGTIQVRQFQSYAKVADSFLIIILAITYFFEKIGRNTAAEVEILKLNSIILIYFALTLIFYLPINFLININSDLKFYFWGANLLLTLLFYVFISWEIWKNGLNLKQSPFGSR